MKRLLYITTVLLSIAGWFPAQASDLEEIIKSQEIKKYDLQSQKSVHHLTSKRYLDPEANFSQIFLNTDGPKLINLWFSVPATGEYRTGLQQKFYRTEYVQTIREYLTRADANLRVEVLVPHPRSRETARFGLVEDFALRSPPKLTVEFTEDISISGHPGKLYTLPDGNCQINLNLDKATLVVFSSECKNNDDLISLANKFSYQRFLMKLNT